MKIIRYVCIARDCSFTTTSAASALFHHGGVDGHRIAEVRVPEDAGEMTRYQPEGAVLYDGTPASGSIRNGGR